MAVLHASGVVVGKSYERRDYINDKGQTDCFEYISVTVADAGADGKPLEVIVSKEQFSALEKFQPYSFPVELFTFNNKKTGAASSMIKARKDFVPQKTPPTKAV